MPIYEYIASNPDEGCCICSKGFELNRPISRPPLKNCPLCKVKVRKKVPKKVSSPRILKPLSTVDAKKSGFTVLKRRDKGVYEKI